MMNSEYTEAYVWIWLTGETEPVVAGKLNKVGNQLQFNYGQSYLKRDNAIAIYNPELPLQSGLIPLNSGLSMPSCLRDAAPDAWGRRVIINRKLGVDGAYVDTAQLDELTYLLESGSDRFGAIDFQLSAEEYIPRCSQHASLDELLRSSELVEKGMPLPEDLSIALQHGTSIGGARPKALVEYDNKKFIAKFSSTTDLFNVVKAEYIAMRLAAIVGLDVAPVALTQASKKDVLLIERFDRIYSPRGWLRKNVVSALTLFELDELMGRYASYEKLAELIRHRFYEPSASLKELFSRLVFNILSGNTDDHARNHAAFWDGEMLALTPAYDICPQSRTGNEASQAMLISGKERMSKVASCLAAAYHFQLSEAKALEIIEHQQHLIDLNWSKVCDEAQLSETDRKFLWRRQFLNPYSILSG